MSLASGPRSILDLPLSEADPAVAAALDRETDSQRAALNLTASENYTPRSVMEAQSSTANNRYAEGYPGRRHNSGCEHIDEIEALAVTRAKRLFRAQFANVQPHSVSQANAAALQALAQPGDTILGLDLKHGGHLTHGARGSYSSHFYRAVQYHRDSTGVVDMAEVRALAREARPCVIIAGSSAYTRALDFAEFRKICNEAGASLVVDMSHFAGLVAAGLHPSPMEFATVVTTSTHRTLGGPRGALLLANDARVARRLDAAVFPGQQGGSLSHVIAAKAVALDIAGTANFAERQLRTVQGAKILADRLLRPDCLRAGIGVVGGGTEVHMVLVDLRKNELDGLTAEHLLARAGVLVNRFTVPDDPQPPSISSGLRLGTAALASRGLDSDAFALVADIVARVLIDGDKVDLSGVRERVSRLTDSFPLYPGIRAHGGGET